MKQPDTSYSDNEKQILLDCAREAIAAKLQNRPFLFPDDVPEKLREEGASFVTLRLQGELRGCIGSLEAREPLFDNVAHNAIQAAFRDPRFPALTKGEFPGLEIHISVLTTPRAVASWQDIEIGRHGMILEKGGHRAVFLPEVANEQGWTLEETLAALARKAGLQESDWQDASYQIFESIAISEHE